MCTKKLHTAYMYILYKLHRFTLFIYVYCTYMLDKYIKTHDVVCNRCIHICICIYVYKVSRQMVLCSLPHMLLWQDSQPCARIKRITWWNGLLFSTFEMMGEPMDVTPFFRVYLVAKIGEFILQTGKKQRKKKRHPWSLRAIAPANWWWQDYFPCGIVTYFSGAMKKNFWGVRVHSSTKIVLFIGGGSTSSRPLTRELDQNSSSIRIITTKTKGFVSLGSTHIYLEPKCLHVLASL